tara:strand:- start:433 stop:744 length:312 start_codon:yes stop_codon:yes gene_type:complete
MAKKTVKKAVKKTAKKVVKKVLDSTDLDEKLVAEYKEHKSTYDTIACYINCYGAYVLAVGAGCMFGVNNWVALGMLAVTAGWAYWVVCGCKLCKGGNTGSCCK